MDEKDKIKKELYDLEQEKIKLEFGILPPNNARVLEIMTKMQPLYRQLGGIYITEFNANYIQPAGKQ